MAREDLLRMWTSAWEEGLWATAWSRVFADLSPLQAMWRPQEERNSIWQHLNHMLYWREVTLRLLAGGKRDPEDVARMRNFACPQAATPEAWAKAVAEWKASHEAVAVAIADPRNSLDRLQYLVPHDSYHVGQVMLLRALQGLKPID